MRTTRLAFALVLLAFALGTVAWLVASVNDLHDRLAKYSAPLALVFVGTAGLLAVASGLAAVRMFWKLGHSPPSPELVRAPEDIVRAAEVQADKAEQVINLVRHPATKSE